MKRLRAKYCGGLQFCQQKQWLSAGVICLALPYGPHAGVGINERGDGPPGENTRTLDAGDLSPRGGCCARARKKDGGKMEVMEIEEKDWRMREQENRSRRGRKGQHGSQNESTSIQK